MTGGTRTSAEPGDAVNDATRTASARANFIVGADRSCGVRAVAPSRHKWCARQVSNLQPLPSEGRERGPIGTITDDDYPWTWCVVVRIIPYPFTPLLPHLSASKIDSAERRAKLKPRDEPYWARLSGGCYIGFRKLTPTSTGTWVARYRSADTGARTKRSLGEFDALPPGKRYDAAKMEAEVWFAHLGGGGSARSVTVLASCDDYVAHIRDLKGEPAAKDVDARFSRWVRPTDLAGLELSKLSRQKLDGWRKTLSKTPAHVGSQEAKPRARSESTVNRDVTALRAALNRAHDLGYVSSDTAWRVALRPTKNVDKPRSGYLDRDQRLRLLNAAPAHLSSFLRALSLVPLRPGALAALKVSDFDAGLRVLTIGQDKAGRDRKIPLPPSTAAFFAEAAKAKLPGAPLISRPDEKAWDKDSWKWPVKAAVRTASLPVSTTAYVLRHSAITDLVVGGLDLATTALLSGTSVAMIERHYMHLQSDRASAALAGLAL